MAIFTGICGALLIIFEILYPWLKKSAHGQTKLKTHMRVGILAVLVVFLHWVTTGFYANFSLGFLALMLFFLTAISGALIRYLRGKTSRYMHIVLSIATSMALFFHILQEVL